MASSGTRTPLGEGGGSTRKVGTSRAVGWNPHTPGVAGLAITIAFVAALSAPQLTHSGREIRNAWLLFGAWVAVIAATGIPARGAARLGRYRRAEYVLLVAWFGVVSANTLLGRGYTGDLHFYCVVTVAMTVLQDAFHSASGERAYRRLIGGILVLLGGEAALSLPTLVSQPGLVRETMAFGAAPELLRRAGLAGVGQYGLYTGLAVALPAFIGFALDERGLRRAAALGFCVCIAAAISLATFMGAILLMAVGFVLLAAMSVAFSAKRLRLVAFYAAIGGIGVAGWVGFVSHTEPGAYILTKVRLQVEAVREEGLVAGDQTGRSELWLQSMSTVARHPFFGVGPSTNRVNPNLYTRVGGHAAWLDQPAEYGILGFLPYGLFVAAALARKSREMARHGSRSLVLGQWVSLVLIVIGGLYNPVVVVVGMLPAVYIIATGGPPPGRRRDGRICGRDDASETRRKPRGGPAFELTPDEQEMAP